MNTISVLSKDIVRLIENEYQMRRGIFTDVNNLLEHQTPKGVVRGSKEHARFYFYLIFNDHGTKSINLYDRFKKLYEKHPELFTPQYIADEYQDRDELFKKKYLSSLGLRYPSQAAKSWIKNSIDLVSSNEGEPINLFKSTSNALNLYKNILKFRSYGPKTSGLLLRVLIGVGFNRNLDGVADVPLPVDIHDSRIAYMCHLYRPHGVDDLQKIYSSKHHISQIEYIWRTSTRQIGVEWEELDRALWLLGSIGCINKRCLECPVVKYCDIGKGMIDG